MTGRVLVAPVTASPTKPLTPSHLKLLLSADVLHRATSAFTDVTLLYHPLAHAGSRQVAGFWEYLDRRYPDVAFDALGEAGIGELYVQFQRSPRAPAAAIAPYVRRAAGGWAHPASLRVLEIWRRHYRDLGMTDAGLADLRPPVLPVGDLVRLLTRHHVCVDGRPFGAPVFLDATAAGLPLRTAVTADGHANYLMSTLGELVPRLPGHDHVVLLHDVELRTDYRIIAHVLGVLGARVTRLEFPRVPIGGIARAARHGDWRGYTLDDYAGPLRAEHGAAAVALGLRCYLVAGLSRTTPDSFSRRHLHRWVRRAGRLLDELGGPPPVAGEVAAAARRLAGPAPYADPHRCLTTLFARDPVSPAAAVLAAVVGDPVLV
ncbi:hypothetical protein GCM10009827_049530 [Dactylosporangium maewongense]|uniref:Uncharacterized protein n=1 Tax=Dactylosporangium maewongense TaxID=634393 RepID=A0ABN2ATM1_9ACTN